MSFIAAAILGSAAIGAGASIYASGKQVSAEQAAQQQLLQSQQQGISAIQGYLSPYTGIGQNVLPTLQGLLTPGPSQTSTLSQLPGYQFIQDWGLKGVQNAQSTRGLGGNMLAGGANFATGQAQQSWGQLVSQLLGLTQVGASAAGTGATSTAGLIGGLAPQVAATTVGQGNALAAGGIGAASAAGGGLSSLANLALLKNLTGGGGMYGSTGMTNQQAFEAVQNA